MLFENLPDYGAMLLPGADSYHEAMLDAARNAVAVTRQNFNIEYGVHPLQKLDIWMPLGQPHTALPVVVFFHGGAFRHGYKEWIGAMAPAITALPAIVVSPNYRLVPEVGVPDILNDCRQALRWVYDNIANVGGDPGRVVLGGHSAGAYIAAMLSASQGRGQADDPVCGCIAVSGLFSLARADLPEASMFHRRNEDFLPTHADQSLFSVMNLLHPHAPPFSILKGESDLLEVAVQSTQLANALVTRGLLVSDETIVGADHFQAHMACNDASGPFMTALSAILRM